MNKSNSCVYKKGGFSLLEIMVVLLVLSVLGAVLAPASFQLIEEERVNATRREMDANHRAITGDPARGHYGYIADMGALPAALQDLNKNPGAPAYTPGNLCGIGMGWNGPYISSAYSADDYLKDEWGRNYLYDPASGQITSVGGDGLQGTSDDIIIPGTPVATGGHVFASVTVADNNNIKATRALDNSQVLVRVYYSEGGSEKNAPAPWDASTETFNTKNWTTPPHQGMHAVKATGLGDYAGNETTAAVLVYRGAAKTDIFLGAFDLSKGKSGKSGGGVGPGGEGPPGQKKDKKKDKH